MGFTVSLGRTSIWRYCAWSEVPLSTRFSWVSVCKNNERCISERLRKVELYCIILKSSSQILRPLWSELVPSKIESNECLWNELKLKTEETKRVWISLYYFEMHQPNIVLPDLQSHFHRDRGWWESSRSSKDTMKRKRVWHENSPCCFGRYQLDAELLRQQCNYCREWVWWVSEWENEDDNEIIKKRKRFTLFSWKADAKYSAPRSSILLATRLRVVNVWKK